MRNDHALDLSIDQFLSEVPQLIDKHLTMILSKRNLRVTKVDGSYVTEGDMEVQRLLMDLIQVKLPKTVVVSEEMRDIPMPAQSGQVIVIDPIDGTENFTSGLVEWGVSIACYQDGRHAGSLLGCPELGQWLRSGHLQAAPACASRIRGLSSSLSRQDLAAMEEGYEYRIIGCCVYNMLSVVRGSFRSFENPKGANAWDILAGLNLALEKGLAVTVDGKKYAGEYLTPDRKYRFKIENR